MNAAGKKSVQQTACSGVRGWKQWGLTAAFVYVLLVLGVDALATLGVSLPFDWSVFQWRFATPWRMLSMTPPDWTLARPVRAFDLYKFTLWFVLPFCICLKRMDWAWFSPRGWKRLDWGLLAVMMVLGGIAVLSIRVFPSLRAAYPGMSYLSPELRRAYAFAHLIWVLAWLPGWEFMHRYFLLRPAHARFPRWGWMLIPLFETLYHLQKPLIEAGGMAVFSIILTTWCVKRRNLLLPFLAHLYIEIMLIICLYWLL